jgi:hypothetical protein
MELEDVLQGAHFKNHYTHKAKKIVFQKVHVVFFSHNTQHLSNEHPSISWKKKVAIFSPCKALKTCITKFTLKFDSTLQGLCFSTAQPFKLYPT